MPKPVSLTMTGSGHLSIRRASRTVAYAARRTAVAPPARAAIARAAAAVYGRPAAAPNAGTVLPRYAAVITKAAYFYACAGTDPHIARHIQIHPGPAHGVGGMCKRRTAQH